MTAWIGVNPAMASDDGEVLMPSCNRNVWQKVKLRL